MDRQLSVAIIGGSGACGRELVPRLASNPRFKKIRIFTRRVLDEWKTMPNRDKLEIVTIPSPDGMKDWDKTRLEGMDTCFCCVGGRTKDGITAFRKTDYDYYVEFGQLAKAAGVPHYSVVSTMGASSSSWFKYLRVKGLAEEAIKGLGMPRASIFRPGMLLGRRNDSRLGEKIAAYIPFIPKVEVGTLAANMVKDAENYHLKASPKPAGAVVYENKDIVKL